MTRPRAARWIIGLSASMLLGSGLGVLIRGAELPSELIDLTGWKLTLPEDTDLPGRPDEITSAALRRFRHPQFFFVADSGTGIVCRAPCGGFTTKASRYPRTELREMESDGRRLADWATDDGYTHTMSCTLAVTRTPDRKPHVACAQIHDARDDLLMVRLEGRKLLVERNAQPDVVLDRSYALGRPFDLEIRVEGGQVVVAYQGEPKLNWDVARRGCYFKAGCYTQSNREQGDAPDSYGEVVIRQLRVTHVPTAAR
ncbi:MAG: polysaccharide lyase family 7 protein [Pirellulaceae bacterium]